MDLPHPYTLSSQFSPISPTSAGSATLTNSHMAYMRGAVLTPSLIPEQQHKGAADSSPK